MFTDRLMKDKRHNNSIYRPPFQTLKKTFSYFYLASVKFSVFTYKIKHFNRIFIIRSKYFSNRCRKALQKFLEKNVISGDADKNQIQKLQKKNF